MSKSAIRLIFECSCNRTEWGEILRAVGNTRELGHWNVANGVILSTSKETYPRWRSNQIVFRINENSNPKRIDELLTSSSTIEFKFVISKGEGLNPKWENIPNRKVMISDIPQDDSIIVFSGSFGCENLMFSNNSISGRIPSHLSSSQPSPLDSDEISFSQNWMGREVRFVKTHSGLKALEDHRSFDTRTSYPAIEQLLKGNSDAGSYLRKLQLVETQTKRIDSMVDRSMKYEDDENYLINSTESIIQLLTAISIYLTFVRSGAIPCLEDGSHHRPSHHAAVASSIFSTLLKMIKGIRLNPASSDAGHDEVIILLIRRILPLLPSFSESFTCSVPLTRIRDIAHRNDIPSDLKSEIKHTLQNKLHRCAGPEDLVAAHKMLQRLLSNRQSYSEGFINEFIQFYEELKEFFNARTLIDRLTTVRGFNLTDQLNRSINELLTEKPRLQTHGATIENFLSVLRSTVKIRESIAELEKSEEFSPSKFQELWLSDIAVEQYAFTLVSQLISRIAEENLRWGELKLNDPRWVYGLKTLMYTVVHIRYSAFHKEECQAIESMYKLLIEMCWKETDGFQTKGFSTISSLNESKLILRSILDRTLRLTERYTETVTELFPPIVREIGRAAGIATHAVEVYAESDIRASIVFQLSRLSSSLLNQVAGALGETGVEVIVEPPKRNSVSGRLIDLTDLWKLPTAVAHLGQHPPPIIVRLSHATGDEEVAGLASQYGVVGIILMHSIPHLSHLSIRARQERIPFIAVVNPESAFAHESIVLVGEDVQLTFTADGVGLNKAIGSSRVSGFSSSTSQETTDTATLEESDQRRGIVKHASFSSTKMSSTDTLTILTPEDPIDEAQDRVGAKAAACGKLMKLGTESNGIFTAPNCWVLPFGGMESTLLRHELYEPYIQILKGMDLLPSNLEGQESSNHLDNLEGLLEQLIPNARELKPLTEALETYSKKRNSKSPETISFIARSSANVEDLLGMSAAGLYESIANINPMKNFDEFARSIGAVWSSLHSRRAILSRRLANVSQELARMAVLIQDLVMPYLSFVVHTRAPIPETTIKRVVEQLRKEQKFTSNQLIISNPSEWVYVELALGLGEILASGSIRGYPFRILIHKKTGAFNFLSFASFSIQYLANPKSSDKTNNKNYTIPTSTEFVESQVVDYTKDIFTLNQNIRSSIAGKLTSMCIQLEDYFGCPQDIEGSVVLESSILNSVESAASNQSIVDRVKSISSLNIPSNGIGIVVVQSRPQPS